MRLSELAKSAMERQEDEGMKPVDNRLPPQSNLTRLAGTACFLVSWYMALYYYMLLKSAAVAFVLHIKLVLTTKDLRCSMAGW